MGQTRHPIEKVRAQFPAIMGNESYNFLDNPAGTQVPQQVIDRIVGCLTNANANLGGYFPTSVAADKIVDDTHAALADFLNANKPEEIIIGQNMTSLTFHVSRSIGHLLNKGDEIILSRMDHEGNVSPWLLLAEDLGLTVKWLDLNTDSFELELSELDTLLSDRTKLVAVGYASNLLGTVNDVKTITQKAKAAGALVYIDAVQFAPHDLIDVQDIGCDFLACSPYKFFGPHQGVLWGREDLINSLAAYKVRPVPAKTSIKFETGTLSHESIAGILGCIEYFEWYAHNITPEGISGTLEGASRRQLIEATFKTMKSYENGLTLQLIEGLEAIDTVTIQGITNRDRLNWRIPTVSFTASNRTATDIAKYLATKNIFVWDTHNFALGIATKLNLLDDGCMVRIGIAHYNTKEDIDQILGALREFL